MCLSFFESNNVSESWWVSSYNTCWLLTIFQSSLEKSSCLGIWIICDVSDVFRGSLVQLSQQRRVLSTTAVAAGTRLCLLPHRHPHSALRLDLSESFEGFDLNSAESLCSATTFKHWQDWQTLWKPLLFLSCWDLQFCMSVKVKFGKIETAECSWVSNWKHQWLTNSLVYSLPVYHLLKIDFKAISIVWTELNVCCICLSKQIKERVGGSR